MMTLYANSHSFPWPTGSTQQMNYQKASWEFLTLFPNQPINYYSSTPSPSSLQIQPFVNKYPRSHSSPISSSFFILTNLPIPGSTIPSPTDEQSIFKQPTKTNVTT